MRISPMWKAKKKKKKVSTYKVLNTLNNERHFGENRKDDNITLY